MLVFQLSFVGLLCVSLLGYYCSSLRVANYHLYHFWMGFAFGTALGYGQGSDSDPVGDFPPFAIYKPVPLDRTAHLSPPHLVGFL